MKFFIQCCYFIIAGMLLSCSDNQIDEETAVFLAQAQQAFEETSYNIALAFTDSAQVHDPELPETFFLRGRIFTELARFDLADAAYVKTLSLDPGFQGAWLNRGNLAIRKSEIQPALTMYQQEAEQHPSSSVFLQIGRAYQELGVGDSARMAYERALELDSTRATIYMRLGQLLGEQGDLEPAIHYTRKGLALEPDNLNYKYALGALLNANGESDEAISFLKPFADASPWHYWGHYNLGQAYQRANQEALATFYLSKAESLQATQTEMDHWQMMAESNPQHLMLWLRFSFALHRAGNEVDAERADKIAYALAPDYLVHEFQDSTILKGHREAIVHIASGELDEATEIYKALLRQDVRNHGLWLNLGVTYAVNGRIIQARQCWSTAIKYNNEFLRARRYREDLDKAFYDPKEPGNTNVEVRVPSE